MQIKHYSETMKGDSHAWQFCETSEDELTIVWEKMPYAPYLSSLTPIHAHGGKRMQGKKEGYKDIWYMHFDLNPLDGTGNTNHLETITHEDKDQLFINAHKRIVELQKEHNHILVEYRARKAKKELLV